MAVMSYFCFYFPMRLAVLICSVFVMIQTIIPAVYLMINNADDIRHFCQDIQDNIEKYDTNAIFDWLLEFIKTNSSLVWLQQLIFHISLLVACILNIIGALRTIKLLMIPFIILELIRIIGLLSAHIITMMVIKSQLNLGLHITVTTAGGFLILFLGYCWMVPIALIQILTEINSKKYKEFKLNAQKTEPPKNPKGITSIYTYSKQESTTNFGNTKIFTQEFSGFNKKRPSYLIN